MTDKANKAISVLTTLKESGYSLEDLIEVILSNEGVQGRPKSLNIRISTLFKTMGVPMSVIGYNYLMKGVELVYEDDTYLRSVVNRLYQKIGEIFNTTGSRAERAMRHAIERMCDNIDPDFYEEIFGNTTSRMKGKPTIKEFFAIVVDYLKMEEKEI